MWRNSKEEWERRKTYLIRSLFEDLPTLSPINESQEPTFQSSSPKFQSSSENEICRPESPLPELIIEKEPPRAKKYHQDEPEEFYDKLAREMRKLYKRDFLHVQKDSTTSPDESCEIENENYSQTDSSLDEDRTQEDEDFDNVDSLVEEEDYSAVSKEEETQKTESTGSEKESSDSQICIYEQITTKVQVHTQFEETMDQLLSQTIHASVDGVEPSDLTNIFHVSMSSEEAELSTRKDFKTVREEEVGLTEAESLARPIEASPKSISPKSPDEYQMTPEIMRHGQSVLSDDFLPRHEIPICESDTNNNNESLRMEIDNTFSMERFVTSGVEMEVANASFSNSNIVFTVTSTPKSSKIRQSKIINKYSRRLVPYSPSSSGSSAQQRKSIRHMALQTSFCDDEPDLKDIWNNFFVGTPTVYNICTCRNHVCS